MANSKSRRSARSEEAELENAYKTMYPKGKYAKKSGSSRWLAMLAIATTFIVLVGGIFAACSMFGAPADGMMRNNLTVAGVDVSGMTVEDAISAITLATENTYSTKTLELTVYDTTVTLSPETTKVSLDVKAAVEAAYRYGQDNSVALTAHEMDIRPFLSFDEQAIRSQLNLVGQQYTSVLKESSYEIVGEKPDLAPVAEGTELPAVQTLKITKGVPEYAVDVDALYNKVLEGYNANNFQIVGVADPIMPAPVDFEGIYNEHYSAPVDAVMDPETFEVVAEVNGYDFDMEAAKAAFDAAADGATIEISFRILIPETTGSELSAVLFRDVLGTYSARHPSSSSDRNVNLKLACESINGVIIYPGDVFSYNQTLGKRTPEKGYKPAAAYVGDKTVTTYGGGICQVSSCLYYATLQADLEIVERDCHRFICTYMPYGIDATVSWGSIDYRFRNTTNYPIRIEAYSDGARTTVTLIGTDEKDYYVVPTSKITETISYDTVTQVMAPDNEKGYKDGDVIISPYIGYKTETYLKIYDKATGELIETIFETRSIYSKRDQVICKIEDPNATDPTDPSVPTEPSTEPSTEPATDPSTEPSTEVTEPTEQTPTESTGSSTGSGGGITEEG